MAQKTIAKVAHKSVTVKGKAATCTKTGLTDGKKCSVCGVTIVAQKTIAKVAHKSVTVKGKAATCTKTGLTTGKKCSVCGKTLVAQKTIAKKAHKAVTVKAKAATCTKTGLTAGKKCSVCGTWIQKQKVVPKVPKPGKSSISKLTGGKKQITVKFKTVKSIKGYEIQFATNKSMTKNKKLVTVKSSASKTTVKKLKAKTKYYVRIRTYKMVNGKKVVSAWSKTVTVKTK